MKRMLFNATHPEQLRVAIVDGQNLINLDLESTVRVEKKGNVYKGEVTKVEPGLEAAFVDYGAARQGFLPLKEIYRGYFSNYDENTPIAKVKIAEVIQEGCEMLVQVNKDERGDKGAALTTFISLAGRFLVLMPNNPKGGGISRRALGGDRSGLRDILANLKVPEQHALIARTAGIGRSEEELQWDLDFLLKLWDSIESGSADMKAPRLIYQESNLIVRSLRDHLSDSITEIIVDEKDIYERAEKFMKQVMPHNLPKLKFHDNQMPLFSYFHVERHIEAAFQRKMRLPSGGSIVIDHTEALTAIDVNSARATKGADIEETALQTNLEAVDEIALQMRVRDVGGLVVMDLIDMTEGKNQRAVEEQLQKALKRDRARTQIGRISRFGLLEMSRQRLRASLNDANYEVCPRCRGGGMIRNVVSAALGTLRLIEEKLVQSENTEALQVLVPVDIATYLLNEKRREISALEVRLASRIFIIPCRDMVSPDFEIKRLRGEEFEAVSETPSYQQAPKEAGGEQGLTEHMKAARVEQPYLDLQQITHGAAPVPAAAKVGEAGEAAKAGEAAGEASGLFGRLFSRLRGSGEEGDIAEVGKASGKDEKTAAVKSGAGRRRGSRGGGGQSRGRGGNRGSGGNRRGRHASSMASRGAGNRGSNTKGRSGNVKPATNVAVGEVSGNRAPGSLRSAGGEKTAGLKSTSAVSSASVAPSGQPTRRDFAAHDPANRVGHRASQVREEQGR